MDAALAKLEHKRKLAAVVPAFLLAPPALEDSDLIAMLPRRLAMRASQRLAFRPVPLKLPPITIFLAWHPRSNGDPRHRWMREALLGYAAHGEPSTRVHRTESTVGSRQPLAVGDLLLRVCDRSVI